MDLKIVSKQPQQILMNLQLLFESGLFAIFVTNSVKHVLRHILMEDLVKVLSGFYML